MIRIIYSILITYLLFHFQICNNHTVRFLMIVLSLENCKNESIFLAIQLPKLHLICAYKYWDLFIPKKNPMSEFTIINDDIPSKIIDNLWLSSVEYDKKFVIDEKIRNIYDIGSIGRAKLGNVKYHYIGIDDDEHEDISQYFEKITESIHEALKEGGVLIHCMAGISRSSAIVIAYLMRYYNVSDTAATRYVKQRRDIIYPNRGFARQIMSI
jgi:protein tyrosine phosphatase